MKRTCVILAALVLLAGCERPIDDRQALISIKAEAAVLTKLYPTRDYVDVPNSQWPRVIKSLKPERVTVYPGGVDILKVPNFDGGWGYYIALGAADLPGPRGRFADLGDGVYWYHPY